MNKIKFSPVNKLLLINMKKVVISPFSRKLRNGKQNPKDYPYWKEVVSGLHSNKVYTIQIGMSDEDNIGAKERIINASLDEIKTLLLNCNTWISVDNFLHHLCANIKKKGVAIFGYSDPKIFGYPDNINLLKSEKYLRYDQFNIWEACEYNKDIFVEPQIVIDSVLKLIN